MRKPSSARSGSRWRRPISKPLSKVAHGKSPSKATKSKPGRLGALVHDWASTQQLATGVQWKLLADSKIRGVTSITGAAALGVPRDVAPRVVAKIAGLVARGAR